MRQRRLSSVLLGLLALCAGCGDETGALGFANPDRMTFDATIYPMLVRDCGFHACHGSHERFYQVFGPGHGRIRAELGPFDPVTMEELEHSFRRAVSMLDRDDVSNSLLLRKPLAAGEGGVGHEGVDMLGRDVYQTRLELNYTILERWALCGNGLLDANELCDDGNSVNGDGCDTNCTVSATPGTVPPTAGQPGAMP